MTFVNRENSVVVLKELIFEWTTSWESEQDLYYFKLVIGIGVHLCVRACAYV